MILQMAKHGGVRERSPRNMLKAMNAWLNAKYGLRMAKAIRLLRQRYSSITVQGKITVP